jgi:hypothetical protein
MKTYFYLCVKRLFTAIGLLILILLVGKPQAGIPALAQGPETTAFVNVNVVPMDTERVLENQTVIVEDGLITAVGPADEVTIPDGAEIVDGQGGYLMPGMADMHMHTRHDSVYTDPEQLLFYLQQGTTTIRVLGSSPDTYSWRGQIERGEMVGPTTYMMGRVLMGNYKDEIGVGLYITLFSVLRLIAPLLLGGIVYLVFKQLRSRQNAMIGGGALLLVGLVLLLTRTPPFMILASIFDAPFIFAPENVGQVKAEIRRQQAWGVDGVKVYDGLTEEQYLAAVAEGHNQGLYVVGHMPDQIPMDVQLTSGIDEIAHVDEFLQHHWIGFNHGNDPDPAYAEKYNFPLDYEAIPQTVALVVENDIPVVSNLSTDESTYQLILDTEGTLAGPEYAAFRPDLVESWKTSGRHFRQFANTGEYRRDVGQPFLMTLMTALYDADVLITVATDSGYLTPEGSLPSYIHRELELLVESGFSNYDALAAGTKNAGIIVERMGRDGNFGTIEVGQRADLILISDNPLENVSATRDRSGVMTNGRWYTQVELDQMVEEYLALLTQ